MNLIIQILTNDGKSVGYSCIGYSNHSAFSLVIVLTAFEISVYYWFIKKYIPKEWYWFAVFIYVFNPNFMLTQSSMMRQTLAMCIVLLSIPYIYKKGHHCSVIYFICLIVSQ